MAAAGRRAPLLYLITDRRSTPQGRTLPRAVEAALRAVRHGRLRAAGAVAVQLREKELGGGALMLLAQELRVVTAAAGVRLFINDRVDVAIAAGADGVHLGGGALSVEDVHRIAPQLDIARSTHGLDEVAAAAADPRISFVVFGPVFDTPSKRKFGPSQGLEKLRQACVFPIPIVALGGVQADSIPACFGAGASGVASMGGVLSKPDPEAALSTFFRAIEST